MRASRNNLDKEVASLGDFPRQALEAFWLKAHERPPPKGMRRDLLIRSAAWHLQAKRLGGLSAETLRLLRSAIKRIENERVARDRSTGNANGDQVNVGEGDDVVLHIDGSATVAAPPRQRRRLTPARD